MLLPTACFTTVVDVVPRETLKWWGICIFAYLITYLREFFARFAISLFIYHVICSLLLAAAYVSISFNFSTHFSNFYNLSTHCMGIKMHITLFLWLLLLTTFDDSRTMLIKLRHSLGRVMFRLCLQVLYALYYMYNYLILLKYIFWYHLSTYFYNISNNHDP